MKKVFTKLHNSLTFEDGCNLYLTNCRQRNLREGTINHYKQSYTQFYRFFDPEMPIATFTKETYNDYILYLREHLSNDISINSYLRDLITTMHFLMEAGYLEPFKIVGHITSIIGIIVGVKEYKTTGKTTGLIVSIIGEVCSVASSLIGIILMM